MMRSSARSFLSKLVQMQIVRALTTIAVAAIGRGVTEGETRKSLSVAAPRLGRDGKGARLGACAAAPPERAAVAERP